jgi:hypothetical protein
MSSMECVIAVHAGKIINTKYATIWIGTLAVLVLNLDKTTYYYLNDVYIVYIILMY